MISLFPLHVLLAFALLILQTYLFIHITLLALRRVAMLKRPYSGMDYGQLLPASGVLLGVLLISSADLSSVFQFSKSFLGGQLYGADSPVSVFARAFFNIVIVCIFYIAFALMNARFLFKGYFSQPSLAIGLLLFFINSAFAGICWFACRESIDAITPRLINFR